MTIKRDYNLHDIRIYCKAVSLDCICFSCMYSTNWQVLFVSKLLDVCTCIFSLVVLFVQLLRVCALCVHDQSWAYNGSSEKGVAERRQAVSALICLLTVQPYFAAEYSY